MNMQTALAYRVLELRLELPLWDIAQDALMEGLDSPALKRVAAATIHDDPESVERFFEEFHRWAEPGSTPTPA
jgi:hypothetical protein